MYLGDGQNLADTLRLTYDELYYATRGKQLRFLRHKTRERNECQRSDIPITPEIQEILNRYGNVPKLGRRVFPIMSELITPSRRYGLSNVIIDIYVTYGKSCQTVRNGTDALTYVGKA